MGFDLDAGVITVDEGNNPRIVPENGLAVVVFAHPGAQKRRGIPDAGLVKVIDNPAFALVLIRIINP